MALSVIIWFKPDCLVEWAEQVPGWRSRRINRSVDASILKRG